ncbi:MBL fold metallo-hydrolase [Alkaliphilus peptidifermentans]|uniref:Ribonuclease BN, tRNA processing enzyme n=1 Tax=Alkaliphilus peptidifermentans DSM 18978 TaxID=1120976 RepID=A0A1G5BYU8_9FIRM|nr:MBL fold metallo-hydrolase [Alkaliphilus peptidifermentans]SCX95246.1 Ribonuclease BN, tRNA processing enzyme [Alkaliphilus peptidifermentans DSM 18978]
MKLTVLGCYGPYPKAKGACSGYLLEDQDIKILIDCGNGVISRFFSYCNDLNQLDGIFISHLHPDHMSDLLVLRYAIGIGQMMGKITKPINLYLPASPSEEYNRIPYQQAFTRNVINEDLKIDLKGLKISFFKTDHPVECYGMVFEKNNKKLVYSGDTKYFPQLVDYIKGSDLFLCEGGILQKDMTDTTPHLSAKQVGEVATEAKLRRIILTHIFPPVNINQIFQEAREVFPNIIEIAEEGKAYYI